MDPDSASRFTHFGPICDPCGREPQPHPQPLVTSIESFKWPVVSIAKSRRATDETFGLGSGRTNSLSRRAIFTGLHRISRLIREPEISIVPFRESGAERLQEPAPVFTASHQRKACISFEADEFFKLKSLSPRAPLLTTCPFSVLKTTGAKPPFSGDRVDFARLTIESCSRS